MVRGAFFTVLILPHLFFNCKVSLLSSSCGLHSGFDQQGLVQKIGLVCFPPGSRFI